MPYQASLSLTVADLGRAVAKVRDVTAMSTPVGVSGGCRAVCMVRALQPRAQAGLAWQLPEEPYWLACDRPPKIFTQSPDKSTRSPSSRITLVPCLTQRTEELLTRWVVRGGATGQL
jgi:hypothetical protein